MYASKAVIYEGADGIAAVVQFYEGARIAMRVRRGEDVFEGPRRADHFFRGWPLQGVTAEWAETEDQFIARMIARHVPTQLYQIIDASAIPLDITFHNAWIIGAGGVEFDMAKCRDIRRGHYREMRAAKMQAADAAFFKTLEVWLESQPALPEALRKAISAKRELRDVTTDPRIEAAQTLEALKAVLPDILK